jgi:hypothetical protein
MDQAQAARRRRTKIGLITLTVLIAVAAVVVAISHENIFTKRFAVVEPGQVFRGGYVEPWPLKRIIEKNHIRNILCLMNFAGDARGPKEEKVASEMGVGLKELPMPGNGCAPFESLDIAAAFIADPANRPLYVHCAAGVQRTGASIAAYRMRYCGWTYEQALAEAEYHGLDRKHNPELYDHLKRYADRLQHGEPAAPTDKGASGTRPAVQTRPAS